VRHSLLALALVFTATACAQETPAEAGTVLISMEVARDGVLALEPEGEQATTARP
jgi:hypothetical protein